MGYSELVFTPRDLLNIYVKMRLENLVLFSKLDDAFNNELELCIQFHDTLQDSRKQERVDCVAYISMLSTNKQQTKKNEIVI